MGNFKTFGSCKLFTFKLDILLNLACYILFDHEVKLIQTKYHLVALNIENKFKCLGLLFSSKLHITILIF